MYISYVSPWVRYKGRYINYSMVREVFIEKEEDVFKVNIKFSENHIIPYHEEFETFEKAQEYMDKFIRSLDIK